MCGIAGLWPLHPRSADEVVLDRMQRALVHRGPDGFGTWSGSSGIRLAHRRLAIIDTSEGGHQPMRSASGRFTVVFNGEIYNFPALRAELDERGLSPAWQGHSDTEVLLAAIEAWGLPDALRRMVGMFAFALWDEREHTLHLVRDRLGVKPLFWTRTPFGLAFASELKALRDVPGFDTTVDQHALAGFFRANCVPGLQSIYRGTEKVPPATILTFASPGRPNVKQYWNAVEVAREGLAHPFEGSDEDAIEALEAVLRDAVRLRMVADVPLGAFLSGGVDSSTVVALMQAQSSQPVRTFSIANESRAFDEGAAAEQVARHLGTEHTTHRVSAADALAVIPRLAEMFDEPFADSSQIPTFLVSQLARRHVTVALSGDGGDEFFGGYTRHVWGARLWSIASPMPSRLRSAIARGLTSRGPEQWDDWASRVRRFFPVRLAGIRVHKAAGVLSAPSPEAMYGRLASHWLPEDRLLRHAPVASTADEAPLVRGSAAGVAEEMMLRDALGYLVDDILTKVDRASMAVSLEAREPLLDHRLFALAWRLPFKLKVRGRTGKWILREVLARHVPPALTSSAKMGFGVPLGDWLRGPLRAWAEALLDVRDLEHHGLNANLIATRWSELQKGQRPWEYHLWDVLMFRAWSEAQRMHGLQSD